MPNCANWWVISRSSFERVLDTLSSSLGGVRVHSWRSTVPGFDVIDSVISEISANIARCWREFPIASVCSCGPGFEAVSVVVALDEWSDDKVEELSGWGKCWWVTRWNAVSRAENKVTWKNSFECNYKTCHQVRSISVCPTYAMENIRQGILKMLIVKFNFQLNNIEIKL